MRNHTAIAVLACVGLLGACGSHSSSDNSASTHEASRLPGWYCAEFPPYPDAEPKQVRHSEHTPDVVQFAYDVGKANGDTVTATFKELYSTNGWAIEDEYGEHRFSAEKASGYSAVIGVTDTKWVTIVSVTARRPDSTE